MHLVCDPAPSRGCSSPVATRNSRSPTTASGAGGSDSPVLRSPLSLKTQNAVQKEMLPRALGGFPLLFAKSSGGFVHVRAQCPSLPHLAHTVRAKSLFFENRFGAPVLIGRRFWFPPEVAPGFFPLVIAFMPVLLLPAPVFGGRGF